MPRNGHLARLDRSISENMGALRYTPWVVPRARLLAVLRWRADVISHLLDEVRPASTSTSPALTRPGATMRVRSIPTVVAFESDGSEVDRLVGVPSRAAFEAFMTRLVALSGEGA